MVLERFWSSFNQDPMTKARALTLIMLSGIAVLAAGTIANAAGPEFCDGYAEQAAHQSELAERFKCAFHGPRWVDDIEAHRDWCRNTAAAAVDAEAASRTRDLRLCMCQWYAEQARAQAAASAAHNCPYTGPRWTLDEGAHYRWCVLYKASLSELESEIATRKELLVKCAP
jgi:hypothetical protein